MSLQILGIKLGLGLVSCGFFKEVMQYLWPDVSKAKFSTYIKVVINKCHVLQFYTFGDCTNTDQGNIVYG